VLAFLASPAVGTALELLFIVGQIIGALLVDEYADDRDEESND